MTHHRMIKGWIAACLAPIFILLGSFLWTGSSEKETLSVEALRDRLNAICAMYGIEEGAYWTYDPTDSASKTWMASSVPAGELGYVSCTYAEETGSAAFAAFLGNQLFETAQAGFFDWEALTTPPLAKASGLRTGDILCASNHAALLLSIDRDGLIRTLEIDDQSGEIHMDGFFLGDDACQTFDQIVATYGFDRLLHAPENTSPVLWSGRMAALPEEPMIIGETYPTVLSNDQFFGLRGTVMCKYPITQVRATVTNRVTEELLFDVSVYPNANTYAIGNPVHETINDQLVFNSPECANSWLKYMLTVTWQKDEETLSAVVLDRNFKVGVPLTEEPES